MDSRPPVPEPFPVTKVSRSRAHWGWPLAWIITALLIAGCGLYVFHSCVRAPERVLDASGRLADKIGSRLADVASAFNRGTITTTFTSYATTMTGHQYLQFATLSQQERFTRADQSSTGFGYIPLPEVIVEADAPVTYTYYLDFKEPWEFQVRDHEILVLAPDVRFNKPAVDASRITYEVKKGSVLGDTKQATENLKSSITSMTLQKARSNVELVRETGRHQTEEFVRNWLARSFTDGTNYSVTVRFRKELNLPNVQPNKKPG